MDLIAIKIGGSVITEKKSNKKVVDLELLNKIANTIAEFCRLNSPCQVLIGNGAGSFGHLKAKKMLAEIEAGTLSESEIQLRLEEIHQEVLELNAIVQNVLRKKIPTVYLRDIVFGDVNFAGPPYIISTEEQFLLWAKKHKKEFSKIILLTDRDGIYQDLNKPENGIISEIKLSNLPSIKFLESNDATGGMAQKLSMAKELLTVSSEIVILNGLKPERLLFGLDANSDLDLGLDSTALKLGLRTRIQD